ncbi:hypothetical protein [Wukongibacter sp. M2B1]|uniref:hypothetical protein n=1 Tax=Wukongibacter sp. M2B1 TaxID=3088895 RepID=UPI003D78D2F3
MSMEKPDNETDYIKIQYEDIDVFLNKTMKVKNDLVTITLSGFFIFKNLEVSGVDIAY